MAAYSLQSRTIRLIVLFHSPLLQNYSLTTSKQLEKTVYIDVDVSHRVALEKAPMTTMFHAALLKGGDDYNTTNANEQAEEDTPVIVRDFAYPTSRTSNMATPTAGDITPVPIPAPATDAESTICATTENPRKLPYTRYYDLSWTVSQQPPKIAPPPPPLYPTMPTGHGITTQSHVPGRHESGESTYSQYSTAPNPPLHHSMARPTLETLISGVVYETEQQQVEQSLAKAMAVDGKESVQGPRQSDNSGIFTQYRRAQSDNSSKYSQYSTANP
jgi:hypothetical protein